MKFQSLGRDSGCSSVQTGEGHKRSLNVSIPRSGFWVFKPAAAAPTSACGCRFNPSVGILGVQATTGRPAARAARTGFNPSVGILGVQAEPEEKATNRAERFQSLGRDSGCSSFSRRQEQQGKKRFQSLGRDSGCSSFAGDQGSSCVKTFQSLGRDSGCSSPSTAIWLTQIFAVSIPRSGFWVFKRVWWTGEERMSSGFNPSVGILGVQAC